MRKSAKNAKIAKNHQKVRQKPYENIVFLALGQKGAKSVGKCEKCEKVRFHEKGVVMSKY